MRISGYLQIIWDLYFCFLKICCYITSNSFTLFRN